MNSAGVLLLEREAAFRKVGLKLVDEESEKAFLCSSLASYGQLDWIVPSEVCVQ